MSEDIGKGGNQRSDQDRRAEQNRRKIKKGSSGNERRDKDGESRRSWVGRRQAAAWRKDS